MIAPAMTRPTAAKIASAQVEQHGTEVAQAGEAHQGDHETDEPDEGFDARGERCQLGQRGRERTGNTGEGDQVEGVTGGRRQRKHHAEDERHHQPQRFLRYRKNT